MKKVLIILTLIMCTFFTACPVAAESQNTEINYTVAESYTWTAPAAITFTNNINTETKSGTLSVSENIITAGKTLTIKIANNEDFLLTGPQGDTRAFTVKKGSDTIAAGGTVLTVAAGTNTGTANLDFILTSVTVQKAGTYSGTCEFVASVA